MKDTAILEKNISTNFPVSRRLNDSNIGQVTNDVLSTNSSQDPNKPSKLICFGVSEGTLNDIAQAFNQYFFDDFFISGSLYMRVHVKFSEIKIDVNKRVIVFEIKTWNS